MSLLNCFFYFFYTKDKDTKMYLRDFKLLVIHFIILLSALSCNNNIANNGIIVTNNSDLTRDSESIEIWVDQLSGILPEDINKIVLLDNLGNQIGIQWVDINLDSIQDYLLFQTSFEPHETKHFSLIINNDSIKENTPISKTYCRIVPERLDDFAWENDIVAFRTYGPKCQQLFEDGNPAGLISSGIDCWLKSVDYPIIDKWYANNQEGISYHIDHGEGLDNYHVGASRGCGGIALPYNGKNVLSENFSTWEILANGPIRSIFELNYDTIKVGNVGVLEKKRITLDLGTNFYHCTVSYSSPEILDTASVGLALHNMKGKINSSIKEGWASYWEPMDDSYLGTAIIVDSKQVLGIGVNDSDTQQKSESNIWVNLKLDNNSFSYWSGFGWEKRKKFNSAIEWENNLKKESIKKRFPIEVRIIKN